MEQLVQNALWYVALPIVAVIGLALNVLIRARGGRSFKMHLRVLGAEMNLELTAPGKEELCSHESR